MENKKWNRNALTKLLSILIAVILIGGSALAYAMIDDTNSVHIDADEIEDSTLIVGTHLIYLGAMTDQVYQIAMDSASESGQFSRYYKSELAGGVWYDVTDAGTLADITTSGKIVQNSEIEDLMMTHHTKSDGITYDLRTNKAVCIFDIKDPYDLEAMEELQPIKLQYDMLAQEDDPTETNKRDMKLIEEIFKKDRSTEITEKWDHYLYELQIYYEVLIRDGADTELSDMVMTVMERVDATRRAEVLLPLQESELEDLNRLVSRDYTYVEGEVTGAVDVKDIMGEKAEAAAAEARKAVEDAFGEAKTEEAKAALEEAIAEAEEEAYNKLMEEGRATIDPFSMNTELITAIGDALTNVQESYTDCLSQQIQEGTTVLSQVQYDIMMELLRQAEKQDFAGCDKATMNLIYLDRIENDIIREEDAERAFIEEILLPQAEAAYREKLFAGESELYQTLPSTAAAATKANALKQQKNDTEVVRNELQFIIRAYVNRMPTETAMELIAKRIEGCDDFRKGIVEDAYADYAKASVDAHQAWLGELLNSLQDSMGNRTMDDLMAQKEDLQTQRMTALDKNQLSVAKKLDAQIAAVDQEIEDLENYLNSILESENTSASEKAQAAAQLGEKNTSALLQSLKNDALQDLQDGNLDGIGNIIDAVGALSGSQPTGALNVMKDIYEGLVDQMLQGNSSDALMDLLDRAEEVTAEQLENFLGDLSDTDLAALIEAYVDENGMGADGLEDADGTTSGSPDLSGVMNRLNDKQMAIVLTALDQYVEQINASDALKAVQDYSRIAFNSNNPYIYDKLRSDPSRVYVPTDRIAKICKYRYIFNDSQKAVTLQKGGEYDKFTAFSAVMERSGVLEDMTAIAGFQDVIYIPQDAAKTYFGLEAYYSENSSYGILLTAEMEQEATAFLDYLLEAGGES